MTMPYRSNFKITSNFGLRTDPISGKPSSTHNGLDLVGESKEILSVTDGYVVQSQIITDPTNRTSEWGNYIAIVTGDKVIYYCHLSERKVKTGDTVSAGQVIGIEGSTGRSTGSHLHFEVRQNGTPICPADFLGIPNENGFVYSPPSEKDSDSIPYPWAKEAVEWAIDNKILLGYGNGELKLRQPVTREEMLVFLHRAYTNTKKGDNV